MDYTKLDAGLALALDADPGSTGRDLEVFIHLTAPPDATARDCLVSMGVGDTGSGRTILTAMLSARDVAALSDQPWVRQIRLARPLRPLDGP